MTRLAPILAALLLGTASAAERPNILFCIADDASWAHWGAYGCSWVKTPAFDRVAREGLLFSNAYTPNAKCAPSRACILTGRNTWQLEAAANHMPFFPEKFTTYVEALGEAGYFTGKVLKGWSPGIAKRADGTNRELAGPGFEKRKAKPPTNGISNVDYAANFDDFLAARPEDKPFCFWFGSIEPHRGYEYGSGVAKGGKKTSDIDKVPAFWPDTEETRNDMLDYAFEIEHFDDHLGRMIENLEKRGLLDNTLIVVTADNGMPFPRVKGQEYEYSNHLPLAVLWKNGITNPGRKIDDFVSFIDLAPTFLEAAELTPEKVGMQPITGRSLFEIFTSEKSGQVIAARDHVVFGKERHDAGRPNDEGYPIRALVADGFLYLKNYEPDRWPAGNPETGYLNCDGGATKTLILNMRREGKSPVYWQQAFGKRPAEEMFDLTKDRECLTNVASDPAFAERNTALRERLSAILTPPQDPRAAGQGYVFDQYPIATDSARFYDRFMAGKKPKSGWVNPTDFEKEPIEP